MKTKGMKITAVFLLAFLTLFPLACGRKLEGTESEKAGAVFRGFPAKVSLEYTEGFSVSYEKTYKIVTINSPWPGADHTFQYVLVQRDTPVPEGFEDSQIIKIPVRSIVTLSTSYLPYLEILGVLDTLAGHDNFQYVYSPAVRKLIDEGRLKEVGSGSMINMELLLDMAPELIMTFGMGGEWDSHPKLLEAGLPVVINGEWAELNPLGRTEWIKFIALFFNKEKEAEKVFDSIEREYTRLAARAKKHAVKPKVFLNVPFQGTWWMSGGGSFAARLLEDAGAEYLWSDDDSTGGIPLAFETVFDKASQADYWLNTGMWQTLDEAVNADERFREFKAFKEGKVFNNNARVNEFGGIDYFESGPANPHIVLADLVKILHPDLAPDHELVYYKRLE